MSWKLKGGHKQETRQGYNLWKPFTSQTKNGVTLTVKDNGSYVLTGTATQITSFYVNGLNYDAGDYTIALFNSTAISNEAFYVQVEHESGSLKQAFLTANTIKSSTTGKVNALSIVIPADLTLNNFTFKPMLLKGIYTANTMPSFEQYGMMPSTDYPSRIKTAGNNVNFFNYNDKKTVDEVYTVDDEGWITCEYDNTEGTAIKYLRYYTNNLKLKTNTQYAIFVEIKNVSGTGRLSATSYYTDSQFAKTSDMYFSNSKSNYIYKFIVSTKDDFSQSLYGLRTLCIFQTGESGSITFRISVQEDTSITAQKFVYSDYNQRNIKIEKNNTDTSSDKYEEQTIVMPVQQEMLQGDYIEDVEHHEWGKLVLKGDEGFGLVSSNPYQDKTTYFSTQILDNLLKTEEVISNYFTYKKYLWGEDVEGIFYDLDHAYSLRIRVNKTIASTTSELNAYLKARYNANDPVMIYYKLANAIDLELTEAQKAVREQKLHTYKNITNINLSDELASIDVTYKKDLDTILNNLQAQIIANASEEVTE